MFFDALIIFKLTCSHFKFWGFLAEPPLCLMPKVHKVYIYVSTSMYNKFSHITLASFSR